MNIGWTGHRPEYFSDRDLARQHVQRLGRILVAERGPGVCFVAGGQRGVDTWAADLACDLGIPLRLILPMPIDVFSAGWAQADIQHLERAWSYAHLKEVADPTGEMGEAAFSLRNERVVQASDLLVAVWTGLEVGGTYDTLLLARRHRKPIRCVFLAPSGRIPAPGERGV